MAKFPVQKSKRDKLKKSKKGRISKSSKKPNGKARLIEKDDTFEDSIQSLSAKKKPSKVELKMVIEALKKNPELTVVRKALKYIPYYLKSEGLTKKILKEIIQLWAEASEQIRVACLLCLIRLFTKLEDTEKRQAIATKLYNMFLGKCRVTKSENMSMIGFMRHSLVELYKIDPSVAFKQAQTSCNQLSVTLKNAYTHKNEETYKTVLNWQYANCLILLSRLITSHEENVQIKSLTNQVIQLNLGALNLMDSPRYLPFYCHLIENLICLGDSSRSFIPILPQIMRILDKLEVPLDKKKGESSEASKRNKKRRNGIKSSDIDDDGDSEKSSLRSYEGEDDDGEEKMRAKKQYDMNLLNHVSLEETRSPEYNIAVLDKVHELLLVYLADQSHKIAFPELVLLPRVRIRKWLKKNPGQPTHKLKALLDKINSDCDKVEEQRRHIDFAFTDFVAVDAWEKKLRDTGSLSLPRTAKQLENGNDK